MFRKKSKDLSKTFVKLPFLVKFLMETVHFDDKKPKFLTYHDNFEN